ncbi:MAG: hypothetical protein IJH73_05120 [Lachnospiraceae bacterium]|nr:hypothetical protein [Lachnospiraceae bacterium]
MGLFKAEYETVIMNFKFKEDDGLPCIQASNGVYYCNAYYAIKTRHYSMWEDGRYENLADDLRRAQGHTVIPVELKMRRGVPVDFKIDLTKLAAAVGNGDIENLELTGWGFFDHPTDF